MKTFTRVLIAVITLSLLASADEPKKLPDLAKVFPSEKFLNHVHHDWFDSYSYATNLDFEDSKKQFISYMGEGWVEEKLDPANKLKAEENIKAQGQKLEGNLLFVHRGFPGVKVGLTQLKMPQAGTNYLVSITVMKKAEQAVTPNGP